MSAGTAFTRFSAERHPMLGKLAFEILVAVNAELGIVGKIGAELHEERPELFIDANRNSSG